MLVGVFKRLLVSRCHSLVEYTLDVACTTQKLRSAKYFYWARFYDGDPTNLCASRQISDYIEFCLLIADHRSTSVFISVRVAILKWYRNTA